MVPFSPSANPALPTPRSLQEAVDDFNIEAAADPIGATQPPLTSDEVIAAIRGWDREENDVDEPTYQEYLAIVSTRLLPAHASFRRIWRLIDDDYEFTVWWVDLVLGQHGGHIGYSYRIRARWISSEPLMFQQHPDQEHSRPRLR